MNIRFFVVTAALLTMASGSRASSEFEMGWESVEFRTQSDFRVAMETDDRYFLRRVEVRNGDAIIRIPEVVYCNIEHPDLTEVHLSESVGGYATLAFTSDRFEEGRSVETIRWELHFKDGEFIRASRNGVTQQIETLASCSEAHRIRPVQLGAASRPARETTR